MSRRPLLALPIAASAALAACASQTGVGPTSDAASQPSPEPSVEEVVAVDPAAWPPVLFTDGTMPEADAVGQAQADAWLAGVVLPPGAVPLDGHPADAASLALSEQGWVCAPMGLATGYWRVPDMGVVEAVNWFTLHPGPGLTSPMPEPYVDDGVPYDAASTGLVPEAGALEGIALTAALAPGGVVVRAEVGAFGDTTVCPTPPPGEVLGGPGQG